MDFGVFDNFCPKCKIFCVDKPQKKVSFYTTYVCPQCSDTKYVCYCPTCTSSIITHNPLDFSDGNPITCPNPACNKRFHLLNCPNPNCAKAIFCATYVMGSKISCLDCETTFEQLPCPHCGTSNYWKGTPDHRYSDGTPTTCYNCEKSFQHLNCPHCKAYKYYPNTDYKTGVIQMCDNCNSKFQHILCPKCVQPCYYPKCDFRYGALQKCQNSECQADFLLTICPECSNENADKYENKKLLVLRKCSGCNTSYYHYQCSECRENIYTNQKNFKPGINKPNCPVCKKGTEFYYCQDCRMISIKESSCQTNKCAQRSYTTQSLGSNSKTSNANSPSQTSLFGTSTRTNQQPSPSNSNLSHTRPSPSDSQLNSVQQALENITIENLSTNRCVSCGDKKVDVEAYPCMHRGACYSCAQALRRCPLCLAKIEKVHLITGPNSNIRVQENTQSRTNPSVNSTNSRPSTDPIKTLNPLKASPKEETKSEKISAPAQETKSKDCIICYSKPADMALVPCGHKKTCASCTERLKKDRRCPLCRQQFREAIRIFE
jgi:Uncharacterized conserved protein, contains RING Zn-finger